MASVRDILGEIGYDMRNYHEESFSFETLSIPARPAVDTDHQVLTETARPIGTISPPLSGGWAREQAPPSTRRIRPNAAAPSPAAQTRTCWMPHWPAGLRLPSSCTQGMCGTCKTTMLSGEVDMQHNGGIRPREIAAEQDPRLLLQTAQRPPH